ncbi:MAG: electron transport complex subunit RsxD [Thiotrichales bacterium]
MEFKVTTSPHLGSINDTGRLMRQVLYALVPGTILAVGFFGWGVLLNVILAVLFAVVLEALVLLLRNRPLEPALGDYSAVVTGWLLGLSLPQLAPWWIVLVGMIFAIVIAKHLYGGLGFNPFNPAMVGYVALLISFPGAMTAWAPPARLVDLPLSLGEVIRLKLFGAMPPGHDWDSMTMATPLDSVKTGLSLDQPIQQIVDGPVFSSLSGVGWEWISLAFAAGGIWMIYKRLISWQLPLAVLLGLALPALVFYLYDAERYASPLFHLLSGGAMLGAFFIATDPVSGSTTPLGRVVFGFGVGAMTYIIRTWGGYPDAIAFSVLLLNMNAPLIDQYTQPRVFGKKWR